MSMRITNFLILLLSASASSLLATAQNEADALRFSTLMPQGTARSMGYGSAVGAVGGDFTSIGVNPGGIGVYRNGEFTITPSLKLNSSNSTYTGNATADNITRFNINNLGLVFTNAAKGRSYKTSKWKAVSFGIGISRSADFSNNYKYSGYNDSSSASEVFLVNAIKNPNEYENTATFAGLGYESYLIDYDQNVGYFKLANHRTGLNQQKSIEEKGGINDINFSFGGNYEEKLFIGATVGIPTLRYLREVTLREEDATSDPTNNFDYFEYKEKLKVTGTGINLKLGFIYNFNKYIRGGVAFHTPTFYSMNDIQDRSVISNTETYKADLGDYSGPTTLVEAPTNEYRYSMISPWRGVVSAAGIIGKHGFVSVDYEYVNYASTRYYFDAANDYFESEVNDSIKNMYKGAYNLRVGGEARFDIVMVRLGFGYYGNPYQDATMGSATLSYSGGVGVRFDNIFIDLGFVHSESTRKEQPYSLAYDQPIGNIWVPKAEIKNSMNNAALTFGVKF
ncbi:MAG: hypothetical protein H6551_05215 [Chitinophagales bacterium]|nr:hypothetical protein [Chitinophagaceae bacterium]MCB9064528.1 hypothetical protein [Chitinophagales bacterium]